MKDIQLLLTIILLTTNSYSQQQIQISNSHQNSYVDSAIFYFNKSKTANGVDTLVFEKGLRMLDSIPVDDNSIKRIQKTAEEFKNTEKIRSYNEIEFSLYSALLRTQQFYKAIDFGI